AEVGDLRLCARLLAGGRLRAPAPTALVVVDRAVGLHRQALPAIGMARGAGDRQPAIQRDRPIQVGTVTPIPLEVAIDADTGVAETGELAGPAQAQQARRRLPRVLKAQVARAELSVGQAGAKKEAGGAEWQWPSLQAGHVAVAIAAALGIRCEIEVAGVPLIADVVKLPAQ